MTRIDMPHDITDQLVSEKLNEMWNPTWLPATAKDLCQCILQFFYDFGLKICGSRPENSVSIYIICKDLRAFMKLEELYKSGILASRLEELVSLLIAHPLKITIALDESELKQTRARFLNTGRLMIVVVSTTLQCIIFVLYVL